MANMIKEKAAVVAFKPRDYSIKEDHCLMLDITGDCLTNRTIIVCILKKVWDF